MRRRNLQSVALALLVAALLAAVVQIYRTKLMSTPQNLEGHIEIEGGMTANPPAAPQP